MASNDSDLQMKIIYGDVGYILEDVPHFTNYIPNLPIYFSISLFRSSSITYVNYIAFTHSLADCLCNTFFFCRHIRIRFDPILLTQLLSKLIGLFIVVIVIWEHNVLCSKCLFFCVLHHQAIFHAHWQHCSSEGFICFDLH